MQDVNTVQYSERRHELRGMLTDDWRMIAASCPTALGALCGQLTFRLAWCREHSAASATKLLQPLDLVCGTLPVQSCATKTSPTDCSGESCTDTLFVNYRTNTALCLLICGALEKHLLTYLLTYKLCCDKMLWQYFMSSAEQYASNSGLHRTESGSHDSVTTDVRRQ